MIHFPFTHLFDAMCPQLEEHEVDVWYPHPVHDLSCNRLGIIVYGDDLRWTSNQREIWITPAETGIRTNIGGREKVVMECYTQTIYYNYQFFHLDNNPYNLTQENLVFFKNQDAESKYYTKEVSKFLARTVAYMNSRTHLLVARDVDPYDYWTAMELPDRVMYLWKKTNSFSVENRGRKKGTGTYKPNSRSTEKISTIKELLAQGLSGRAIARAMDIDNGMVAYYVRKIKTCFDI